MKLYSEYLNAILNTVHDVIITTDVNGTILDANSALYFVFGYELNDIRHQNITVLLPGGCVVTFDNRVICNGIKKDNIVIRCEVCLSMLAVPRQDAMQLYVIQDVSERECLKEKLYASIALSTKTMQIMADSI